MVGLNLCTLIKSSWKMKKEFILVSIEKQKKLPVVQDDKLSPSLMRESLMTLTDTESPSFI